MPPPLSTLTRSTTLHKKCHQTLQTYTHCPHTHPISTQRIKHYCGRINHKIKCTNMSREVIEVSREGVCGNCKALGFTEMGVGRRDEVKKRVGSVEESEGKGKGKEIEVETITQEVETEPSGPNQELAESVYHDSVTHSFNLDPHSTREREQEQEQEQLTMLQSVYHDSLPHPTTPTSTPTSTPSQNISQTQTTTTVPIPIPVPSAENGQPLIYIPSIRNLWGIFESHSKTNSRISKENLEGIIEAERVEETQKAGGREVKKKEESVERKEDDISEGWDFI